MNCLASFLVAKPLNILLVAVVFLSAYLALRVLGIGRNPRWLLIASAAWGLYSAWEWLVQVKTPEADIRVDLLVMWPMLALLSAWALFRTLR